MGLLTVADCCPLPLPFPLPLPLGWRLGESLLLVLEWRRLPSLERCKTGGCLLGEAWRLLLLPLLTAARGWVFGFSPLAEFRWGGVLLLAAAPGGSSGRLAAAAALLCPILRTALWFGGRGLSPLALQLSVMSWLTMILKVARFTLEGGGRWRIPWVGGCLR